MLDLGATLYEATRRRREATMNKKYLRQQQAPPPAIERDRRSHGKPLPRSPMHILPAVAKVSHVSLPTTLSMANNPRPEHIEKRVTPCKREDARELDLFDSTSIRKRTKNFSALVQACTSLYKSQKLGK